ncbi:MAG: polyprenyl synthetase family protein, partial [Actinomycetales bacterium]
SLIATSARFGALFGGAPEDVTEVLTNFGEKIGIAFQLADDVIDIASDSNQSGKTPGTDLKEGVPTLVTLQIMKSTNPKDAKLREKLSKPVPDNEVTSVIAELRSHQALVDARNYLHQLARDAKAMLNPLPENNARAALESLCDAIVDRTV